MQPTRIHLGRARVAQLGAAPVLAFLLMFTVAGCGDDPPVSEGFDSCSACTADQVCIEGFCRLPTDQGTEDSADGSDMGPDLADATDGGEGDTGGGDADADDGDAGEGDAGDGGDTTDGDVGDDTGEGDGGGDTSDGGDASDGGGDTADTGDAGDGGDAADTADTGGASFCPLDELEANNTALSAQPLHDGFLAGTDGVRGSVDRIGAVCGDLAFDRCEDDGEGDDKLSGPCECATVEGLGACASEDPDFIDFRLLTGDQTWVRVTFADGAEAIEHAIVQIYSPPTSTDPCGLNSDCRPGGGFSGPLCIEGTCRSLLEGGEWIDADGDLQNETREFNLGGATVAAGASGVIGTYTLKVHSTVFEGDPEDIPELEYDVLVQVAPNSRDCLHDAWDADWSEYRGPCPIDAESCIETSEDECGTGSCTITLDALAVEGRVCTWDKQDLFRHTVSGELGEGERRVRVSFPELTLGTVGTSATLYRVQGDDWACVGEVGAGSEFGVLEADFDELRDGSYQLVVKSNLDALFEVSIGTPDGETAPAPDPCP